MSSSPSNAAPVLLCAGRSAKGLRGPGWRQECALLPDRGADVEQVALGVLREALAADAALGEVLRERAVEPLPDANHHRVLPLPFIASAEVTRAVLEELSDFLYNEKMRS